MSFPNFKIVTSFIDAYISNRKANVWGGTRETASRLWSAVTFSPYEGPETKELECNNLKSKIKTPPESGKTEFDKWIDLCFYLGTTATTTFAKTRHSMLASYMHLIRTYIIFKLNETDTKLQLDKFKQQLRKQLFSDEEKPIQITSTKPEEFNNALLNKALLNLAYLGNEKGISEACKKNLLSMYELDGDSWPICFDELYFQSNFFDAQVKGYMSAADLAEYEASIQLKLNSEERTPPTLESLPEKSSANSPLKADSAPDVAPVITPAIPPVVEQTPVNAEVKTAATTPVTIEVVSDGPIITAENSNPEQANTKKAEKEPHAEQTLEVPSPLPDLIHSSPAGSPSSLKLHDALRSALDIASQLQESEKNKEVKHEEASRPIIRFTVAPTLGKTSKLGLLSTPSTPISIPDTSAGYNLRDRSKIQPHQWRRGLRDSPH